MVKRDLNKNRIYRIWKGMKQRCYNTNQTRYKLYGLRGIKVCSEWLNSFQVFEEWANNNGYNDGLTLDRIDVNGNYEPSNCRWATAKEQANNRRNNRVITYKGENKTLTEWATLYNMSTQVLRHRLKIGMTIDEALETPLQEYTKLYTYKGETHNISEWSKITNINERTISRRLQNGMTIDEALETPVIEQNKKYLYKGNLYTINDIENIFGVCRGGI